MSWLQRVRALFSNPFGGVEVSGVPGEGVARPFGPPATLTAGDDEVLIALDHSAECMWAAIPRADRLHVVTVNGVIYHHTREQGGYWVYAPR